MSLADVSARPAAGALAFGSVSEEGGGPPSAGVSWAAVVAGAFVTAALSLILLSLGAGLGLSSLSFWGNRGQPASEVGTAAILWLIFNEIVSSALGGYLAGRLRTRWIKIHNDEVYFRDTAHGLLVWAVAVIVSVSFMAAAASRMAGAAETGAVDAVSHAYFVDSLFRSGSSTPRAVDAATRNEADQIITYSLSQGDISAADENYLEQLVAAQTGLDQTAAQKRVSTVVAEARQALQAARKAAARLLLWIFVALLAGAFSASLAATAGGRQRDHIKSI
jgi:hypothetical protein